MKKLLLVPGFTFTSRDYKISFKDFELIGIKKYSQLTKEMIRDSDVILAHSLGCLEICEFLEKKDIYSENKNKVILYNPIIEGNFLKILKKIIIYRIDSFKDFKTNRNLLSSSKNFLLHPIYTLKNFFKVINTSLDYKLNLYKKYDNIYLAKKDFYSGEYQNLLKCENISGDHDEIFYNKNIIKTLLKGK